MGKGVTRVGELSVNRNTGKKADPGDGKGGKLWEMNWMAVGKK